MPSSETSPIETVSKTITVRWFPTQGTPKDLSLLEIGPKLRSRRGLLWIDCADPREFDAVLNHLPVDEFTRDNIKETGGRTKLTLSGGVYQVPVFDCVLENDSLHSEEITIAFATGWLFTARMPRKSANPFPLDKVRQVFEIQRTSHKMSTVGLLLWSIADTLLDRYFMVTSGIDDQLDDCEQSLLDDSSESTGRAAAEESKKQSIKLFVLGKSLIRFRHSALPMRDVVVAIVRREVPFIDKQAIIHFQDVSDHLLRINDFVESQRDVIAGLRDAELALTSNRLSLVQQKIAAWGALFLIATLITGVMGMNFRDQPNMSWRWGFLATTGIILVIATPIYTFFRRREWI